MPTIGLLHIGSAKKIKALEVSEQYHATMHGNTKTQRDLLQSANAELRDRIRHLEGTINLVRRSREDLHNDLSAFQQVFSAKPDSKVGPSARAAYAAKLKEAADKLFSYLGH